MQLIDIIIIVALAIFIVTRFTSVQLPTDKNKGKKNRSGSNIMNFPNGDIDMKNEAFSPKPKARKKPSNFDTLSGVEQLKAVDNTFNEKEFMKGAEGAYGYLMDCTVDADEEALEGLTSPRLFDRLMEDIDTLEESGMKRVVEVKSVEAILLDARLNGMTAIIDVKYSVNQSDYCVDAEGKTLDGFSEKPEKVDTVWTWARNINSEDPNWELEEISNFV